MKYAILLLEDDINLSDTIKQFLEHHEYEVYTAYDALRAKEIVYEKHINLMLLDIKVPYQNGFDFLCELREQDNQIPAIFITSLHSVDDVTKGFDSGCDDYIRKPFALKELLVRVESLLKRRFGSHDSLIKIDELTYFDTQNLVLHHDGKEIPLKEKELRLLVLFLEYPDELISKERIFDALWEYDEQPSEGSLRTYIKVLRSHLGKERIETVKNMGYRFVCE